jgi:pyrroline-5-carboxylate reductase
MTVFFIGGGNMAYAIIGGMDRKRWRIIVDEPWEEQRQRLEKDLGVETVASISSDLIKQSSIIVLATKPQSSAEVLGELKKLDLSGKTVLSIMAGVSLDVIAEGIGRQQVRLVRTMPNTPLLVKLGVTGVYTTDESAKKEVEVLLGATSKLFFVKNEDDLNAVTGVSGSGPAYFFAFIEALAQAGADMGLDHDMATQMAIGTALGAATLAANSKDSISTLRKNVTSKGGTTEQALLAFERNQLGRIVKESAVAARDRGRELSKAKL